MQICLIFERPTAIDSAIDPNKANIWNVYYLEDAIGPRGLRQQGRAQRVGISATPCIAQGRNMIDIDA